jgi:murein DD-endopeptidase MepM/ murein hydrolase activator NlpD
MVKIINLIAILATIAGCTSNNKPAVIENKQDLLFTKNGTMQIIRITPDDTLESVAIQYKTPVEILASINNLTFPYYLVDRRHLLIPQDQYYKITKNNESIAKIARKYHISSDEIQELNNWLYGIDEILPQGEIIRLPRETYQPKADYTIMELEEVPEENIKDDGYDSSFQETPIEEKSLDFTKDNNEEIIKSPFKLPSPLNLPEFIWPIQGKITIDQNQEGLIIYANLNSEVKAIGKGRVIYADNDKGEYGNLIIIKHSNGYLSAYAHNSELLVQKSTQVVKGQTIAKVGQTGSAKKPQLFFSMRKGKNNINPDKES